MLTKQHILHWFLLQDMINEVDVDENGFIEFAEFVILMSNRVVEMTKEEEIA